MYRLHCLAQSGNSFKVAFLLRALGQPWEPVYVDFMHGATREPAWRAEANEMGEVPVLETEDGRRLTQSGAIMSWLADRHGAFGGADADGATGRPLASVRRGLPRGAEVVRSRSRELVREDAAPAWQIAHA